MNNDPMLGYLPSPLMYDSFCIASYFMVRCGEVLVLARMVNTSMFKCTKQCRFWHAVATSRIFISFVQNSMSEMLIRLLFKEASFPGF